MSRMDLAQHIRIKFGCSQFEPSEQQLDQIIQQIEKIKQTRQPTDQDWREATRIFCPSFGKNIYAGQDNSDLNRLLDLLKR